MSRLLRITFVRHAESAMNVAAHIIGGRSNDTPLSEKGQGQAKAAVAKLVALSTDHPVTHIVSSPAVRTLATASLFAEHVGLPITVEDGIQEMDQRSLTGRLRAEVYTPAALALLNGEENVAFGTVRLADEETRREVEDRMVAALHAFIATHGKETAPEAGPPPHLVCFSHGVAMRCLKRHITGEDYAWVTRGQLYPNCGVLVLDVSVCVGEAAAASPHAPYSYHIVHSEDAGSTV